MPLVAGSSYYAEFATANPTTGAAQNGDSLPTATATHNGTDDVTFSLTVTNLATGRYKVTGTIPSGYATGDYVQVSAAATVATVAGVAIIDSFNIGPVDPLTAAVPGSYTSGTAGYRLGYLDVAVSSRSTYAGGAVASVTGSVGSVTGSVGSVTGSVGSVTGPVTVGTNNDKTGYSLATPVPTAAQVANAVWTDATAGDFALSGTPGRILVGQLGGAFGAGTSVYTATALANAPTGGGGGDPWATALPGAYAAGTAGAILGVRLDVAVSSRSTYAGGAVASVTGPVTVGTNGDKTGYSLAPTGLDALATAPPVGAATTWPQLMVQLARRFSKKVIKSAATRTITLYADDQSTVVGTLNYTDDGAGNETQGPLG